MLTFPPGADGGAVGKAHGDAEGSFSGAEDAGYFCYFGYF